MEEKLKYLGEVLGNLGVAYHFDYPMSKCTSFRVGGPADLFCSTGDRYMIREILRVTRQMELPITIIGRGSNLIVSDKGVRGVVLSIKGDAGDIVSLGEGRFYAGAGVSLASIACYAFEHELTGLEFAHGIPGNLGGGIYMNAGAYGGELRDVITRIYHLDTELSEGSFTPYEAFMSYRYSDYSVNGFIITGAEFHLEKGERGLIKERMDHLMEQRTSKQPIELPSAGSTFKRPKGAFAAALIEQCGLKGFTVGGAQVSLKHSGFVVNIGGATCQDILMLCEKVRHIVKEQTGFDLELEPLVIGEF